MENVKELFRERTTNCLEIVLQSSNVSLEEKSRTLVMLLLNKLDEKYQIEVGGMDISGNLAAYFIGAKNPEKGPEIGFMNKVKDKVVYWSESKLYSDKDKLKELFYSIMNLLGQGVGRTNYNPVPKDGPKTRFYETYQEEMIEFMERNSFKEYAEIRANHYDDIEQCFFIDAWETDNDAEEGIVIAKVYADKVEYLVDDARKNQDVQALIPELTKQAIERQSGKTKYIAIVSIDLAVEVPVYANTPEEAKEIAENIYSSSSNKLNFSLDDICTDPRIAVHNEDRDELIGF
jgi:hypothetical protein